MTREPSIAARHGLVAHTLDGKHVPGDTLDVPQAGRNTEIAELLADAPAVSDETSFARWARALPGEVRAYLLEAARQHAAALGQSHALSAAGQVMGCAARAAQFLREHGVGGELDAEVAVRCDAATCLPSPAPPRLHPVAAGHLRRLAARMHRDADELEALAGRLEGGT